MKINFRIIIVTLLSSLSFLTVHAQTDDMDADFIEAVKKYLKAAPNSLGNQKEQLLKVFTELNKSIAPELDDDNSQQYVEEYLGEQFVSDVAERLLAKGLNGLVSTDDLKKLTEALQSPEGKDLQQKATKMNSITSAAWEDFGKRVVMQLMLGKTPEPLEQNSEIPESYTTLFKQYYAKSGLGSLSSNMMQGLTSLLSNFGAASMVEKLDKYFSSNLPTLYLNSMYNIMDEGNLRFAIKLADMPAYKNVVDASSNMMKNLPQTGMTIMQSYLDWLRDKGVKAATE